MSYASCDCAGVGRFVHPEPRECARAALGSRQLLMMFRPPPRPNPLRTLVRLYIEIAAHRQPKANNSHLPSDRRHGMAEPNLRPRPAPHSVTQVRPDQVRCLQPPRCASAGAQAHGGRDQEHDAVLWRSPFVGCARFADGSAPTTRRQRSSADVVGHGAHGTDRRISRRRPVGLCRIPVSSRAITVRRTTPG
jgi:hypothetical protein